MAKRREGGLGLVVEVLRGRRTVVVSGAGVSTESGIPDYRGPETRRRARNPVTFQAFTGGEAQRQRYWARSTVGWPQLAAARPNAGHRALARLEEAGFVAGVITQNVDGLHQEAGSRRVVELHGSLHRVRCLECDAAVGRAALQRRLLTLNPGWLGHGATLAPDGDADLAETLVQGFRAPACRRCDGALKPDVVFFGESVPTAATEAAWALFEEAEAVLVVGSSLAVYSGYRFALHAAKRGLPLALVNLGPTRADRLATVKLGAPLGEALPALADALAG